jgi:hypothetical protein
LPIIRFLLLQEQGRVQQGLVAFRRRGLGGGRQHLRLHGEGVGRLDGEVQGQLLDGLQRRCHVGGLGGQVAGLAEQHVLAGLVVVGQPALLEQRRGQLAAGVVVLLRLGELRLVDLPDQGLGLLLGRRAGHRRFVAGLGRVQRQGADQGAAEQAGVAQAAKPAVRLVRTHNSLACRSQWCFVDGGRRAGSVSDRSVSDSGR